MKIQVRIEGHEFSAEGPEEVVQDQFSRFLAAIGAEKPPAIPVKPPKKKFVVLVDGRGRIRLDQAITKSPVSDELLKRLYSTENAPIKLNLLGPSPAVSLMLLLYGFRVRLGLSRALGADLLAAAQLSGMGIERVDRTLAKVIDAKLVKTQGERRGKYYSLTDAGTQAVERLLMKWEKSLSSKG